MDVIKLFVSSVWSNGGTNGSEVKQNRRSEKEENLQCWSCKTIKIMKGQRRIMQVVSLREKQKERIKNKKHRNIENKGKLKRRNNDYFIIANNTLTNMLNNISLEQKDASL